MNTGSAIDLALRCYPGWWQERYADEVRVVSQDLTAEGRSPVRVTLNLLEGAFRARSRAQGMPKTYGLWSVRTRTSVAAATLPWLLVVPFVMATLGSVSFHSAAGPILWSGFSAYPSHLQLVKPDNLISAPPLTAAGHVVRYSVLAINVLFLVTFIVLISGWSGLARGIRRSDSLHRRRLRLLAWAPVFAILVDVAFLLAQDSVRPKMTTYHGNRLVATSGGSPSVLHVLNFAVPIVLILGWLISVACVAVAARRADIAPAELRFGKSVAVGVASLFGLFVAAYAVWGISMIVQSRQTLTGNFTTIGYPHSGLWLPVMLVLVIGVAVSVVSARAARGSWRVISATFL